MRLAVISDVHANLPALEAVLEDVRRLEPTGLIVAGDLVMAGPYPTETARLLRSLDGWMIRGNSDEYILRLAAGDAPQAWLTSHQWALLRWSFRQMDLATIDFVGSLPLQRVVEIPGTAPIRIVHGSPEDPAEGILPEGDSATLDRALVQTNEPVLVCGHTHVPWKVEREGRLALNPGAVAGPLSGDTPAQYAILTWSEGRWQAEHRAVPYDQGRLLAAFHESGLLEEGGALARAFLLSEETGGDTVIRFVHYAYRLAAEAGFEDCEVVPDDVWKRAEATFDWEVNAT